MNATTIHGGSTTLSAEAVEGFAGSLQDELITPEHSEYDKARSIWNAMIDRRPALIARCRGTDDVRNAVRFARDRDLLVAIRGGGHNIAGNAVCDGGLMIDLSPMDSVQVDPDWRTARVGPGCSLADFDGEAQAHGLATPLGINSTTGVAGLTLGGGFGWLSRKHGMTVDNLLSADVVTADGELLRTSEDENGDLFWALRGGGGNFGVVTSFEFRLHPVGPDVHAGLVIYPFEGASEVLRRWRDFVREAPEELSVWPVIRQAPPLPFLPEKWHGRPVLVLAMVHAGDPEVGAEEAEPVKHFGEPVAHHVGPTPYAEFQQAFDPLLTPGARNYWKSHDIAEMTDEAIDALIEQASKLPTFGCEIFVASVGGEMGRVAPDATAYAGRNANYIMNVHARWDEPQQDEACIAWARDVFQSMAPHSTGGVYMNFLTQEETDRIRAAYGPNYERLAELKAQYDPTNLFRMNQNIPPA